MPWRKSNDPRDKWFWGTLQTLNSPLKPVGYITCAKKCYFKIRSNCYIIYGMIVIYKYLEDK